MLFRSGSEALVRGSEAPVRDGEAPVRGSEAPVRIDEDPLRDGSFMMKLFKASDKTSRIKVFSAINYGGRPLLLQMCQRKTCTVHTISTIMSGIWREERLRILKQADSKGWTSLHAAIERGSNILVSVLLSSLDSNQRFQLLSTGNWERETPLHFAVRSGNTELVVAMLTTVTAGMGNFGRRDDFPLRIQGTSLGKTDLTLALDYDELLECLQVPTNEGLTALHMVIDVNSPSMVRLLRGWIKNADWLRLIANEYNGQTLVKYIADSCHSRESVVKEMLSGIDNAKVKIQLQLPSPKNNQTPSEILDKILEIAYGTTELQLAATPGVATSHPEPSTVDHSRMDVDSPTSKLDAETTTTTTTTATSTTTTAAAAK